jgi:dihydrofolate synthase/folylpolyglutamate synthase
MSYLETIKYLDSFVNYEKKPDEFYVESLKLERVTGFLRVIGYPQQSFKSVHIAGTKGKGSACAFTAHILREAGYKVGLFTSPHLSDVRERIRILRPHGPGARESLDDLEGMIPKKDLAELVSRLKPRINKYCEISQYGPLSFFEIYTILAFAYFKEQKVDFAVLETGMGGRLDATNVVIPVVCGITSISYDHTDKLGNTLTEIAGEKAGIIKRHTPQDTSRKLVVVSAPQEEEAAQVIRNKCVEENAVLYEIGKDIKIEPVSGSADYQEFNVQGRLGRFKGLRINLLGSHQLINATMAVSLVSAIFIESRENFKAGVFKKGLQDTFWPARFEIVSRNPLIVLDGAHNAASARALVETLKQIFPEKKVALVLGISRDKDIPGITRLLFPVADKVIITSADNPRSARPADILSAGREFLKDQKVSLTRSVLEALKTVRSSTLRDSLILVAGSLFVVGEARAIIKNMPDGKQA